MVNGEFLRDRASDVVNGVDMSVPKQRDVLLDSVSESAGKAKNPVPVELAVLERSTLNGAMFDPASLAGKEILLWFWAPW